MKRLSQWIWQRPDWPNFTWSSERILALVSRARLQQGKLLAKVSGIGFELMREASADNVSYDLNWNPK